MYVKCVQKYTSTTKIMKKTREISRGEKTVEKDGKLSAKWPCFLLYLSCVLVFSWNQAEFFLFILAHKISIIVKSFVFAQTPFAVFFLPILLTVPELLIWWCVCMCMKFGAKNHSLRFYFAIFVPHHCDTVRFTLC